MEDDHPNILHGPRVPLEIPKISLGQFIFARLKTHNPYDVIMCEAETGRIVSPVELLALGMKVAEGLKEAGILPGDVVCIVAKAQVDVYATATGILFQGATVFPVDHHLTPEVFRVILKTTSPKLVFCDAEISDDIAEVLSQLENPAPLILYNADTDTSHTKFEVFSKTQTDFRNFRPVPSSDPAESVAFLVCSSGTMGLPKPVMITDRNLVYQATVWGILTSFNKLLTCPAITFSYFFWISGVLLYIMVVSLNFEMTIVQKMEARHVLQVIDRQKPVWGVFAPALAKYLTWHPEFKNYNVSSLMLMITGGCSLQKVVSDKIKDLVRSKEFPSLYPPYPTVAMASLGVLKIVVLLLLSSSCGQELWGSHISCRQSYGVTELSGAATTGGMDDDILSVGRLLPGFKMKVVSVLDESIMGPGEEGELYFKSDSVMKGYKGNEEATKKVLQDGWYRTGDIGRYTDTGLIYITGRLKDFIRSKNAWILPTEIEDLISAIPGVADVGVVGISVDENEQILTALVVRMPGAKIVEEDILNHVRGNLPEHKQLRGGVYFVDFIPRTPSGKMKRNDLLDQAKALYEEE